MKKINISYYAFLRDFANKSQETLETEAKTPKDLYQELKAKYDFNLCSSKLKVAINDEFCAMDMMLNDGDKVVFIPPVAGG
jgi:molybdopterin converting factor subunit 1